MTEQQAMRMALEALEFTGLKWPQVEQAITALRQALEQQPEQEPVAWRHDMGEENGGWEYFEEASCPNCQPLYTTPPQRKPLSFEQAEDCFPDGAIFAEQDGWLRVSAQTLHDIIRNVEAAHGIKENK